MTRKTASLIFFSVLLLEVFILAPRLAAPGLWSDELFTAAAVRYYDIFPLTNFERKSLHQVQPGDSFLTLKAAESHPPLYDAALNLWARGFGDNPAVLRSLGLLCLLSAGWIWYAQALREESRRIEYLSVGLLIISLVSLHGFAVQARNSGFTLLLASLLYFSWQHQRRGASSLPFYLVVAASFLTHFFLAIMAGVVYAQVLFKRALLDHKIEWGASLPILAISLWTFLAYHSLLSAADGGLGWGETSWVDVVGTYALVPYTFVGVLAGIIVPLVIWNAFTGKDVSESVMILLVVLLTLSLASVVTYKAGMLHIRHVIFVVPWVLILYFGALAIALAGRRRLLIIASGLSIPAAIVTAPRQPAILVLPDEGYDRAAAYLAARHPNGGGIAATWSPNRYFYQYYIDDRANGQLQMHMVSSKADMAGLCEKIAREQMPLFAHVKHKELIDSYLACVEDKGFDTQRLHFGAVDVVSVCGKHRDHHQHAGHRRARSGQPNDRQSGS